MDSVHVHIFFLWKWFKKLTFFLIVLTFTGQKIK